MSTRRRTPPGRIIWAPVLRMLMWFFTRVTVSGAERIPATGAGVVYYNHIHWLDPALICGRLKRYAVPLAKVETSRWPVVGYLLRWYHVIFITRGGVDRRALQATWQVLRDGDISVISPEGTRSMDGRLRTAKEGLGFVARQVPDAWLIPCAVTGTLGFRWSFPFTRRQRVHISYGHPFRLKWPRTETGELAVLEGRAGRELLREMTDEAMVQLAAILPPEMRGDYVGSDPAHFKWLEFLPDAR